LLAIELQPRAEVDFELEVTGFATAEIDLLIGDAERTNDVDPADCLEGLEPEGSIRQDPAKSRAFSARSRTPTESSHTASLGGGESGIRTHGRLPYTRFPSVRLRPLGHLSGDWTLGS
jgi:hypothetical protein